MIWIVQSPDDGHLLTADRVTFAMPGLPGASREVWNTRDEAEARTLAAKVGGDVVGIEEPPPSPRMPMPKIGGDP